MKKLFICLASALIILTMVIPVSAASLTDSSMDMDTHGDWVGKYGADGYYFPGDGVDDADVDKIPSYASLSFLNYNDEEPAKYTWYDQDRSIDEAEARIANAPIIDPATSYRRASCIYDGEGMLITVDVGAESKIVTLYFLDYDENSRDMLLIVTDEDGNELYADELDAFSGGQYFSATVSGKVTYELMLVSGSNTVVSGVFFDPDPNAAVAEVAVVEAPAPEAVPAEDDAPADDISPATTLPVEGATEVQPAPVTSDSVVLIPLVSAVALGVLLGYKKRVR